MIPFNSNQKNSKLGKLLILIILSIIIGCSLDKQTTGTVDETDTGIVAILYNPDGTGAIGANVKFFEVSDTTKTFVSSVVSDSNGNYSVHGLAKGTYNVYAEKGSLIAFQDSIVVLEDTVLIEADTLEMPKNISGIIGLQPNHDPRTVTVQVLGTDIYSNVNEDGFFTLNRMAKGNFKLKLSTTLDNYTTTYEPICIDADTLDTLSDTLLLIYTGIPVIEGLSATYDTINGIVTLSWNATKYRDFQEYIIYRDYFDSLNMSSTPIAFTDDTVFQDTIFDKTKLSGVFSSSDTNDYHLKYRVIVLNNSQEKGLSYKYIGIIAVSPLKVKTEISIESYHKAKGFISDSASINDSLQIIVNLINPTHKLSEIKYTEIESDSIVRLVITDSLQQIKDTLYHKWESIGQKKIEISVKDLSGTIWKDTFNFHIIDDLPCIQLENNLAYLNIPFNIKGFDSFGKIESLNVDTSHYVKCQKMSDTVIQVTIMDTITDNFELNCQITDDDGNNVNKSFIISTGLQWEKIADNFLDTNTIRSVIELNNTLLAFVTNSNANELENYKLKFSLYSSTDAINWSKIVDSLPWNNWFTKPILYNEQIFLIEGISDSTDTNRIWFSSNGIEWQAEQLVNFPKWFSRIKYPDSNFKDFQEMIFVSFNGKLWAGSKDFYGSNTEDILMNSDNGITWNTIANGETPPFNAMSTSAPTTYSVANDELWYIYGTPVGCYILKTNNFISHTLIGSLSISGNGILSNPIIIKYLNKVFICSNKLTTYGGFMTYINNGTISQSKYEYPGSLVHSCVVFNNRLYSISNNGVFVAK